MLELQNAFLNRTGTQSQKFMIVLATNRMEDLDEAVLSRMDHKIYIGPPEIAEGEKILNSYLSQFFTNYEINNFLNKDQIKKIAKNTKGLTGRALFKLLNAIATKKAANVHGKVTEEMIHQTVSDFAMQEQETERRKAAKKSQQKAQ